MSDDIETTDETPEFDDQIDDDTEVDDESTDDTEDDETFPREVVEKLRHENGKHRQKNRAVSERLHVELVRSTGRLADPTDLPFDADHLDDADALTAAIDDLLERKPHLASRKLSGDIGQGRRGDASAPFSLLGMLKERT